MNKRIFWATAVALFLVWGYLYATTYVVNQALTVSGTLTASGHTVLEGVTSTGATGTGKFVYDGSPTLVTPNLGTPSALVLTNATGTLGFASYFGVVGSSYVQTDESRTSATPGALATADSCTFTLPAGTSGKVLMMFTAGTYNTSASIDNTFTAVLDTVNKDAISSRTPSGGSIVVPAQLNYLATGLTAASHTLQVFYSSSSGTLHAANRGLLCVQVP